MPQVVNDGGHVVPHGFAVQVIVLVFGRFKRRELGRAQLVDVGGIPVAAVFIRSVQLRLVGQRLRHGYLHHVFFGGQRQRLVGFFIHVRLLATSRHRQNPMQALVQFTQRLNEGAVVGAVRQRHVRISAAVKRGKLLAQLLEPGDQRVDAVQHGVGALGGGHAGKERVQHVVGLRLQAVALALGGHVHHEGKLLNGLRSHDFVRVVQHLRNGVAHRWNRNRHGLDGRG